MGTNQSSDASAANQEHEPEASGAAAADRDVQKSVGFTTEKACMPRVSSSPSLHLNMMRHVKNRDPFSIYEVLEVLGMGSMGSVSRVRKRRKTIGGSARPHNVSGRFGTAIVCDCNPITGTCSSVPIVGGIFRACCGGRKRYRKRGRGESLGSHSAISGSDRSNRSQTSAASDSLQTGSSRSVAANIFSSSFRRKENLLSSSNQRSSDHLSGSLHVRRGENYEICLALKSIHLSRVTDETYVNELKNEIDLLRSLDHPHIVRPIEVFEYRHQIYFTMEALSGGDLYARDPYTEGDAARIITAILSAIAYMHSKKIVHRYGCPLE